MDTLHPNGQYIHPEEEGSATDMKLFSGYKQLSDRCIRKGFKVPLFQPVL